MACREIAGFAKPQLLNCRIGLGFAKVTQNHLFRISNRFQADFKLLDGNAELSEAIFLPPHTSSPATNNLDQFLELLGAITGCSYSHSKGTQTCTNFGWALLQSPDLVRPL